MHAWMWHSQCFGFYISSIPKTIYHTKLNSISAGLHQTTNMPKNGWIRDAFLLTRSVHYTHPTSQIPEGLLLSLLGKHFLAVAKLWNHSVLLSPRVPSQDRRHESVLIWSEKSHIEPVEKAGVCNLFDWAPDNQCLKWTWGITCGATENEF